MSPISTIHVYLFKGTKVGNVVTYTKLIDIKDFPDLGGTPELLEKTTLSEEAQTFIKGVRQQQMMEFTANYTFADYDTLASLTGANYFEIRFGINGEHGKFRVYGESAVWLVSGGVNSVVDMKFGIFPSVLLSKVPKIGVLTVTSVAGATSGKTKITVTPAKSVGNAYFYKTAATVDIPMYDDISNATAGYTAWNGTADITATTGHEIVIVEVNADGQARLAGKATVVSL